MYKIVLQLSKHRCPATLEDVELEFVIDVAKLFSRRTANKCRLQIMTLTLYLWGIVQGLGYDDVQIVNLHMKKVMRLKAQCTCK